MSPKNLGPRIKQLDSFISCDNLYFLFGRAFSVEFLCTYVCKMNKERTLYLNTPISRVSCLNVENPENQDDQFWASLPKTQIY